MSAINPLIRVAFFTLCLSLVGCSTTYPNKSPNGEMFPDVKGESLENTMVDLPNEFSGKVSLLLLGYVQNSQFDIDRWLIGLDMTSTQVDAYELPTIQGMFPRFFKTQINQGMRKGIPKELWKGVITIYDDGEIIQAFTGNTNPNNARVLLLDENGKIVYFYDRGFSVAALNELRDKLQSTKQAMVSQ